MSLQAYLDAIETFMEAPKRLVGADQHQVWVESRDLLGGQRRLKLPLEVNSVQSGQALLLEAYPNLKELQFHIMIVFEPTICRLDYELDCTHANGWVQYQEDLPKLVKGPHFHPWNINKRFFNTVNSATKLQNAIPLGASVKSFDSALRWFCGETKIELPGRLLIELPHRDKLL